MLTRALSKINDKLDQDWDMARPERTDVFISYAAVDRVLAVALADDLKARGIRVWWAGELCGGEAFGKAINTILRQCRAVVVIWTRASIASDWVYAEALFAREHDKLVPVLADCVGLGDLSTPFNTVQTLAISDRAALIAALSRHGVSPREAA